MSEAVYLTPHPDAPFHWDIELAQAEPETTPPDLAPLPDAGDDAFTGLTHAEVLKLELPTDRYLVEDLIPAGAVGTIAGVPETHKSWLAQAVAVRVAAGEGEILGRPVVGQATVGYFWQDDSTREEAERVKLYEQVHPTEDPDRLPLRWFLNEGIRLPDDLDRFRDTIARHGLGLALLDSFYNFAAGVDLRDEGAEQIIALLKREIADATGCTILIVDHMPWATETNRQRLRAYGGVFKSAATRFGIYIDAQQKKLYIEARGNNIRGFKKTPAYWDADALELRLIDTHEADIDALDSDVEAYVEQHPGQATSQIAEALEKRPQRVREALKRLSDPGRLNPLTRKASRDLGRPGTGHYWFPHNQAETEPSQLFGTPRDASAAQPTTDVRRPSRPTPRRGDASADGSPEHPDSPDDDIPL